MMQVERVSWRKALKCPPNEVFVSAIHPRSVEKPCRLHSFAGIIHTAICVPPLIRNPTNSRARFLARPPFRGMLVPWGGLEACDGCTGTRSG